VASEEARFAPVGALRGGLALMVVGGFLRWGPLDVPHTLGVVLLIVGLLLVAVALGIRTLAAER
jgi:hypothetical protein